MNNPLIFAIMAVIGFVGAPFVATQAGVSAMMMAFMLSVGSTMVLMVATWATGSYVQANTLAWFWMLCAGILQGLALFGFYGILDGAAHKLWDLSEWAPIILVVVPIGLSMGAVLFFQELVTLNKVIGTAFGCVAIYFLSK